MSDDASWKQMILTAVTALSEIVGNVRCSALAGIDAFIAAQTEPTG